MIIYLVRHGETAYNRDGLGLGRADAPLTDRGRLQVEAAASRLAHLPLTRVFSSPLQRCLSAAEAITRDRDLVVTPEPALLELDVGETEGLRFAEMRERYGDFLREWQSPEGHTVAMPGGESIADLVARLRPFIEQLFVLDEPAIAVVSHNFVIRVLIAALLGLEPSAFRAIGLDLASICTLERRGNGRVMIHSLNDHCHILNLEH